MEKCTQNLANEVIDHALATANQSISLFIKSRKKVFNNLCEDTLVDLLPLARILARKCKRGQELLQKLEQSLDTLQLTNQIEEIVLSKGDI